MRTPTLTEQKLIVLQALSLLGSATALQLLRFMVENDLMNYIELQIAIAELSEAALLRKTPHDLGVLYSLSAQGHEALKLFQSRVPHSIQAVMRDAAAQWRNVIRTEKQVLSDWELQPGGEYTVRLKLLEHEIPLLDMSLSVPTREQANLLIKRWPQKAGELYAHLMFTLGEAGEGDGPEPDAR